MNNEMLKQNILKLAREHKNDCHDPECEINMTMIGELIARAGIKLTDEEFAELI